MVASPPLVDKVIEKAKKKRLVRFLTTFVMAAMACTSFGSRPMAQATAGFSVAVGSECKGSVAVFNIVNKGDDWPKTGTFAIYDTAKDKLVMKRELRLVHGQKATFKVRRADRMGDVGLAIDPSWFRRAPGFDAMVRCR